MTQDELKAILSYNPITGVFRWRVDTSKHVRGERAGTLRPDGHIRITVKGKKYRANRLAWFYMMGEWPKHQVDHHNRDTTDDAWKNLRDLTPSQNSHNAPARNPSGLRGVTKLKNGRFQAVYRSKYIGCFDTAEMAHGAWAEKAKAHQGKFFCPT